MSQTMIVAGVMSGTSADGINVALVRIAPKPSGFRAKPGQAAGSSGRGRPLHTIPLHTILGHAEYPYPKNVRAAVLAAMNATRASVADLARLNFLLGELYADAVLATQRRFRVKVDLVGCHGQTLYHQGEPALYLERRVMTTWQTGEAAIVAARVGVPVVSDFRPADLAAGGKGAPLVPYLDYLWFHDTRRGRIVQNIGGIGNLTAIPAGAAANSVVAFDTGPGNMVIDAVIEKLFGMPFDRGGRIAASGEVIEPVVAVDCIVGPGNIYVAAAKKLLAGEVAIDFVAGPTEIVIIAAEGDPRWLAADMLAQAEHDVDASAILLTTSRALAEAVAVEIDRQLATLPTAAVARPSIDANGAIMVVDSLAQAVEFSNALAPEHLSLHDASLLPSIRHAGSVFLGASSPEAAGDYASGPNHVLPTSGAARLRGGLSAADFVKVISVQELTPAALARLAPSITTLARAEGLEAHARSVEVRC